MGGPDEGIRNLRALAFLELSPSRPERALAHLTEIADLVAAEDHLERLEHQSVAADRAWGLAVAGRCRGLLLSARGDLTGAVGVIDDALEHHRRVPMPFEHGRTLLVNSPTGSHYRLPNHTRDRAR